MHDYCEIGASYFTPFAPGALFDVCYERIPGFVCFQNLLGTEGNADTTSLAPPLVNFNLAHVIHYYYTRFSSPHQVVYWTKLLAQNFPGFTSGARPIWVVDYRKDPSKGIRTSDLIAVFPSLDAN